jgi:DNA topoisomerase-1
MRLRRADPAAPGYRRRRRGRGFSYLDCDGEPITDPGELGRIRALVIPPAWRDVWICPDPRGHIQAVGIDQAGRRQYRYHDVWRVKRDAAKFDHVLDVAERLPALRTKVSEDLAGRGLGRQRILATATRLLDRGVFRIGSEEYATADSATEASYGLATLQRDHVCVRGTTITFEYPAKGGVRRSQTLGDPEIAGIVRTLLRRDDEHPELLAYRFRHGWRDVRSTEINEYLRAASGCDISAKDFRTWHATVLAAAALALPGAVAKSRTGQRRAVSRAMREVAEYLGNTPAVARASYVDPRVVDRYRDGTTIAAALPAGVSEDDLADLIGHPDVEAAVRALVR